MLQRILLIILVLYAVWRIVSAWGRRLRQDGPGADSFSRFRRRTGHGSRVQKQPPEELVACSRCGTYVPARRALTAGDGAVYCSTSCRDASELAAANDESGA